MVGLANGLSIICSMGRGPYVASILSQRPVHPSPSQLLITRMIGVKCVGMLIPRERDEMDKKALQLRITVNQNFWFLRIIQNAL